MTTRKLKKGAMCTDIHFGKKMNSELHNEDCINYLDWFCENVKNDPTIDHVWFLGDWNEQRAAINGLTLKYSYAGAKKLNELGIPVYFLLGNHDLHYRNTREVYSTEVFDSLSNFILIKDIQIIENIAGTVLAIPFLNPDEYENLVKFKNIPVAIGHLELAGFVLSGENSVLEHGPDHKKFFKSQKRVFSGHFHRRQQKDNVHYIGNTFPMDFSDANDTERGMAVYDFESDNLTYIDWADGPKYIKAKLSDVLSKPKSILDKNARVKVLVDQDITLTENIEIRKLLQEKYSLREITLEEQIDTTVQLSEIEQEVEDLKLDGVNEIVPELLKRIQSKKLNPDTLVKIYRML